MMNRVSITGGEQSGETVGIERTSLALLPTGRSDGCSLLTSAVKLLFEQDAELAFAGTESRESGDPKPLA